jgi:hypothetical protein
VLSKFRETASLALPGHAIDRLEQAVLTLEEQPDVRDAFSPLSALPAVSPLT